MKGSIILIGAAALILMQKKPITSQAAGSAAVEYTNNPLFDQSASDTLVDYANQMKNSGSSNLDIFNKLVDNYNSALTNYSTNHTPPPGSTGLIYSQGSSLYYGPGYYPEGFNFNYPPGVYGPGFAYAGKTLPIGWTYDGPSGKALPVY